MESYTFKISDLTITEEGSFPIKVSVSNPNGNEDEDASDNTLSKSVLCTTKFADRKVLLEHFTTAQCGNCPAAHTMLDKILGDNENVIWIAHHAGFNTDNFTIKASEDYLWFYNSGSTYAPAIMFDRTNLADQGATSNNGAAPGPVFFPRYAKTVESLLDIRLNEPAFVTMKITKNYNEETRELSVTASGYAVDGQLPGNSIRMNVFLTEDGLKGTQSGASGTYTHNHVIRETLSGTWGDEVVFDNGQYTKTYTTTLSSKWEPENMKIAAFLSNYDSKSANNCQVYNAEQVNITSSGESSINKTESDKTVSIYHSNGTVYIKGNYDEVTVYSADGSLVKKVSNTEQFNLENGMYLVKVNSNNAISTHKLMICQ